MGDIGRVGCIVCGGVKLVGLGGMARSENGVKLEKLLA